MSRPLPEPAGPGGDAVHLSVVIPAYNESPRLPPTLDRVFAYLAGRSRRFEVIVVDDGSRDDTAEVARRARPDDPRLRVLSLDSNRGKGGAVRAGVEAARGEIILFSDADLSAPIEDLPRLEEAVAAGAGVAIGSRAVSGADVMVRQPWYRQTMGKIFNLLVQAALLPGIWDSQCGFKLFRAGVAREIFSLATIPGFSFDVEILYLALRRGHRVAEVPVHWVNSPASRVHPIFDSARMLRDLARIRWNAVTGVYGPRRPSG